MKNTIVFVSLCLFFSLHGLPLQGQGWWGSGVSGEGPTVERNLDLAPFSALKVSISGDVHITQGSKQSVRIVAQENIIALIKTEVEGGTWHLGFKESVRKTGSVQVYITMPTLRALGVTGSGQVFVKDGFKVSDDFSLSVTGSGDIEMALSGESVSAQVSGSGSLRLRGSATRLSAKVTGSGSLQAYDLPIGDSEVVVTGSGSCKLSVRENLEARVTGSGSIYYKGSPRLVSRITGSGDVQQVTR